MMKSIPPPDPKIEAASEKPATASVICLACRGTKREIATGQVCRACEV